MKLINTHHITKVTTYPLISTSYIWRPSVEEKRKPSFIFWSKLETPHIPAGYGLTNDWYIGWAGEVVKPTRYQESDLILHNYVSNNQRLFIKRNVVVTLVNVDITAYFDTQLELDEYVMQLVDANPSIVIVEL